MAKYKVLILDTIDRFLPITIAIPFSLTFFGNSSISGIWPSLVQDIKTKFVHDLKAGLIREYFIRYWLKEIFVNKVLFNNDIVKGWVIELCLGVIKNPYIQRQAADTIQKNVNSKELNEKCYDGLRKNKKTITDFFWRRLQKPNGLDTEYRNRIIFRKILDKVEKKNYREKGYYEFYDKKK